LKKVLLPVLSSFYISSIFYHPADMQRADLSAENISQSLEG